MIDRTRIGALAVVAWLAALAAPAWAAPANDDFEHARPIAAGETVPGTLAGATRQTGDPGPGIGNVWFSYTAAASERVGIEMPVAIGTVDTPPRVYAGADHDHLVAVPTIATDPWYGRTLIDAAAGQTYWIMVAGWEPDARFELRVRPAAVPSNDDLADARRVRVPGLYKGTLEDATLELGEHARRGSVATVWYRIRPRHSSPLTVDALGSSCGTTVGAFTGDAVGHLHRIAQHPHTIRFHVVRGHTYLLRVGCGRGYLGDYRLDISDGSIAGKGVHLAVPSGQTIGSVRRHGLRLDVGARRKVAVSIDLRVDRRTADRLGLRRRTLGHVRGWLGYGQEAPATLRLGQAARRALSGRRRLDATLRLTLLDHGPNRVLDVRVRLSR